VARDLVVIFSACDALLPSFFTHYATGVGKWCPPANRDAPKSWFVDVLKTKSGCGRPGDAREGVGGDISRVMPSRVHGVFGVAYALHGNPMPGV